MENIIKRRLELKEKLRGRQNVFGAWTSIGHPSITEIFTRSGIDFVGIDVEHSTISQEQTQRIIAASQAGGALCLPRIATHNMEMIKRMLDSGADGVIVPTISTVKEVEHIIEWSKYPPQGSRGFGIARGQGYGFDFEEYTSTWNAASCLIVQIESIEGVKNIESILSVEGVDGVMVGPYDLSGSLGIPGQIDHPRVQEACENIVSACKKFGKGCGTQIIDVTNQSVENALERGYTIVVLASDIFLLWKWSEHAREIITRFKKDQ